MIILPIQELKKIYFHSTLLNRWIHVGYYNSNTKSKHYYIHG